MYAIHSYNRDHKLTTTVFYFRLWCALATPPLCEVRPSHVPREGGQAQRGQETWLARQCHWNVSWRFQDTRLSHIPPFHMLCGPWHCLAGTRVAPSTSNVYCSTVYHAEVPVTVRLPSSESAVQYSLSPILHSESAVQYSLSPILHWRSSHAVASYCVSRVGHHQCVALVTSACGSLRSNASATHALCVRPHTVGPLHPCVFGLSGK